MKRFEEQFESALSALARDARSANVFVYTELTLHHFFGGDFEVLDRVNPHAGFWNGVLASLQTSGFIALGRLYDHDNSDYTIHALLEFIKKHPGLFKPAALEQRRIRAGMPAEQAQTFVVGASSLTLEDITNLRTEFEHYRLLYESHVQPIRHSVFAHAGRITPQERDALFTKVFIRELEKMVVFPLRLHRALFGLYMNGAAALMESPPTNLIDVLNAVPGNSTSTWEHLHVVRDVAAMVVWIKTAPVPPERIDREIIARLVRATELDQLGLRDGDFSNEDQDQLIDDHKS